MSAEAVYRVGSVTLDAHPGWVIVRGADVERRHLTVTRPASEGWRPGDLLRIALDRPRTGESWTEEPAELGGAHAGRKPAADGSNGPRSR